MMNSKIFYIIIFVIILCTSLTSQTINLNCKGGIPTSIYFDKKTESLYAGCWGGIWKYNGSPGNWTEIDSDPENNILANAKITAMFIDSRGVFYAGCDDRTQSYISYDGGIKWQQIESPYFTLQTITTFYEHKDGTVLVGTNSGIIKTTDNGKSWNKISNVTSSVNCFFTNLEGKLFAGLNNGLYCSTDGGDLWQRVTLPGVLTNVFSQVRTSKNIMYLGTSMKFYKSVDDGNSWQNITTLWHSEEVTWQTITRDDIIFCIARGVLCHYEDSTNTFIYKYTPGFSAPMLKQLYADSSGYIYGLSERYGVVKMLIDTSPIGEDVDDQEFPYNYSLCQNYPNPFNPETVISYQLPMSGHVQLRIYDLLGRVVATLVDEYKQAGNYNYTFSIINYALPSGIYFYTLKAGDYISTKKMVLMK